VSRPTLLTRAGTHYHLLRAILGHGALRASCPCYTACSPELIHVSDHDKVMVGILLDEVPQGGQSCCGRDRDLYQYQSTQHMWAHELVCR
jgi:hypothetical protein